MIIASNISLNKQKVKLIHPMDLSFSKNEFCVVMGANGAGKSSLLHLLAGSEKTSTGNVEIFGENILKWNQVELAKKRAFLQQSVSLSADFTVRDVIKLGRFPYPEESSKMTEDLVDQQLEQFELETLQNRSFNLLSGGEKQRVHFARVLLQLKTNKAQPQKSILFLDEPLNNLDIHHQTALLIEARKFVDEGKGIVIAVIHDLNLSFQFGDRAILLEKGQLIADGNVCDVFQPTILSQIFKTKINNYETTEGMRYFFAEKGHVKHFQELLNQQVY